MKTNKIYSAIALIIITISNNYAATVKYGRGDLGVHIVGNATHTTPSGGRHVAVLSGEMLATILKKKMTLAQGSAKFDSSKTTTHATGNIKALGVNLINWNEKFQNNTLRKYSTTPFSRSVNAGVTFLSVGPIRLKLDCGGSVVTWAENSIQEQLKLNRQYYGKANNTSSAGYVMQGGICADAAGYAVMSLDFFIARAWLEGSVRLGKKNVLSTLQFDAEKMKGTASLITEPLQGAVIGYFRIKFLFIKYTYKKKLWSYAGSPNTILLYTTK